MSSSTVDVDDPLPFEDLFIPLVLAAREQLRQRVHPAAHSLLTAEAHAGWERYLLHRLTNAGAKAAHWQFQVHLTVAQLFCGEVSIGGRKDDACYRSFVGDNPHARLQRLFEEFPRLKELCDRLADNWVVAVGEFLTRLKADFDGIHRFIEGEKSPTRVEKIEAGISDPHDGGRCVARVGFDTGAALVYKPRSIAPEQHFFALIEWLNGEGIPHPLKAARCWDCGDYGWVEHVKHGECASEVAIHRYYWRAGALLGLMHVARSVDMHQENLIAAGEYPVLIDMETLWHPQDRSLDGADPWSNSIFRTGFLPLKSTDESAAYCWSGITRASAMDHTSYGWLNINKDNMCWSLHARPIRHLQHLPVLDGQSRPANEYVSSVAAGFQWVGDWIWSGENVQDEFSRWLREVKNCPRRRLLRTTQRYQACLEKLTSPRALRAGAQDDLQEELGGHSRSEIDQEILALRQLDVPCFRQKANTTDWEVENGSWIPSKGEFEAQLTLIAEALKD